MVSRVWWKHFTFLLVALTALESTAQNASSPVMTLVVDETQAARRIAFVHEEIRVEPGALSLAYPRWIPGEHGATGPIQNFADLRIRAGNDTLAWARDLDDVFLFHVQIPAKADRIAVDFAFLPDNTISDHQILLAWNTVILYPRGIDKQKLMIETSVVLPPKWMQASSLKVTGESKGRVSFAPVSLESLIDSPVLAGEFLKVVPLKAKWPAELDITADSQAALDKSDDLQAFTMFGNLIDQDRAMFGFRHWEKLHILVSESDDRFDGLEHEDSPYNGIGDAGLGKRDQLDKYSAWLLTHEQSHSWDGKYRRPADLYSKPDFQGPEQNSLLWVYEGLNQYIGMLLATRAGFDSAEYKRDMFAWTAANQILISARSSSALVDTAVLEPRLRGTIEAGWISYRRLLDFYLEGALDWLRADTIIREQTQDRLSLDDFLRSFFGQRDTGPIVVPYTREDVETSLSAISPYDWHTFFEARIYQVNSKPPTDGMEAAGWRLVFTDQPNRFYAAWFPDAYDASLSIGIDVKKDGTINDVWPGKPAYDVGLGPHMIILAVDGHVFSTEVLNEAIAHPKNGKITLIIRNFDSVETREISYAGGERYAHLERIAGTRDYLSEILQPRKIEP